MNIPYNDAVKLFKAGDLFVVNEKVGNLNVGRFANVGEVVSMNDFYVIGVEWGIKYNFVNKPDIDVNNQLLHQNFIDPLSSPLTESPKGCVCNILLHSCTCGAFQKEKEQGFTAQPRSKHTYF